MKEKISILSLDKKIKKEIDLGEGVIEVYFPSNEKIIEIENYFDELYKNTEDKNKLTIDSREMLFYVIPMLTNLDYSNIKDDSVIWGLIDNPPYYLQLVKEEIKEILSDIATLKTKKLMNSYKQIQGTLSEVELLKSMPDNFIDIISNKEFIDDKTKEKANKIMELVKPKIVEKTEDELKIEELERQLTELKNKKQE